ncbi:MAG: GatB/YqeY domain-containing protein [Acidobacteria bacterium]|nr:GatB/YqeY domain-containing protein [Acidobacteriota bacterium]
MSFNDRIQEELKDAMRSKDQVRLSTLRLLKTALVNERIAKVRDLTPEDEMEVVRRAAKQRRESIEAYEAAGRNDLAEKERAELAVIEEYLPEMLSAEETAAIVDRIIAETGAASKADTGKVMGALMSRHKSEIDGRVAKEIVAARLEKAGIRDQGSGIR